MQNTEKSLNPDYISNYARNVSDWAIVFLYFSKTQVKIEYFLFVSTHFTSVSFMDQDSAVALSMLTVESVK